MRAAPKVCTAGTETKADKIVCDATHGTVGGETDACDCTCATGYTGSGCGIPSEISVEDALEYLQAPQPCPQWWVEGLFASDGSSVVLSGGLLCPTFAGEGSASGWQCPPPALKRPPMPWEPPHDPPSARHEEVCAKLALGYDATQLKAAGFTASEVEGTLRARGVHNGGDAIGNAIQDLTVVRALGFTVKDITGPGAAYEGLPGLPARG